MGEMTLNLLILMVMSVKVAQPQPVSISPQSVAPATMTPPNILGPLSSDFIVWLYENNYGNYSFERLDLDLTGSFGGRHDHEEIERKPIVFVHGNSDGALAIPGVYSSGWSYSIEYFLSQGYSKSELYATTWGNRKVDYARFHGHTCEFLMYTRRFIEAVLEYTKAPQIDIIAHSMGVTLARRAVKGGTHFDDNGLYCDLGEPLSASVDTFLGISGANYGMCTCAGFGSDYTFPTCSSFNGFWPGDPCSADHACINESDSACPEGPKYSYYLTYLNEDPEIEGQNVISIWSNADDVLMNSCLVYGRPTTLIPNSSCYKVYDGLTHMETKELTVKDQHRMVVHHHCV